MAGDKTYIDVANGKREQRERLIRDEWRLSKKLTLGHNVLDVPNSCGLLTERELDITTGNDALDIIEKIRAAEYTAEEVTVAFCKRAAIAQQLVSDSRIRLMGTTLMTILRQTASPRFSSKKRSREHEIWTRSKSPTHRHL